MLVEPLHLHTLNNNKNDALLGPERSRFLSGPTISYLIGSIGSDDVGAPCRISLSCWWELVAFPLSERSISSSVGHTDI